jgi:hypothetical protein
MVSLSRNRLTWLGWTNIAFGVASLARVIVEIVTFGSWFFESRITVLFSFDAMEATLWIASGICLLFRKSWGFEWTAISAGAAAARTILSIVPLLSVTRWALDDDSPSAMGARFLHYGLEFLYWPVVLFQVFRVCEAPPRAWRADLGIWTGLIFAASVLLTALLQVTILSTFT